MWGWQPPIGHFPADRTAIQSLANHNGTSVQGRVRRANSAAHSEVMMSKRFSTSMVTVSIAAAALSSVISLLATQTSAQAPAHPNTSLKTPWGEPDLQGIWTEEFDTPVQRPPRYANQEFFTEAQRQELD